MAKPKAKKKQAIKKQPKKAPVVKKAIKAVKKAQAARPSKAAKPKRPAKPAKPIKTAAKAKAPAKATLKTKPASKPKAARKPKLPVQTPKKKAVRAASKPAPKPAAKSAPKPKAAPTPKGVARVELGENKIVWTLNPAVYPLDHVYQTAFIFIDRAYLLLDQDHQGRTVVTLKGKTPLGAADLEALRGEFANELLNQGVRQALASQNSRIRELIVAKALYAAARPGELNEIQDTLAQGDETGAPRPWDQATKEEQDELDRLLAEIEKDFAEDPMGIAVPWDEKYGEKQPAADEDAPVVNAAPTPEPDDLPAQESKPEPTE
ncbi:MAG: His-Xaa-Ser system protein HxsD [Myxococcales bacterium]|nr:MAG: His-Xaa-Ser system protein HxsD [Myxococcales bacterium]